MDRHTIASGLLRDLWRIYDHGGHSMRSMRAQLLETDWPYAHQHLENTQGVSFNSYLHSGEVFPTLPEQYFMPEPEWANDREARYLVLTGLMLFYETQGNEHSVYEYELVKKAAMYAGMPQDASQYISMVKRIEPFTLISRLRYRASKPPSGYAEEYRE